MAFSRARAQLDPSPLITHRHPSTPRSLCSLQELQLASNDKGLDMGKGKGVSEGDLAELGGALSGARKLRRLVLRGNVRFGSGNYGDFHLYCLFD